MANNDKTVKIDGDALDALRAALAIPNPSDPIKRTKRDWEKEKAGAGKRGRPKKKKPQPKAD